VPAALLFASLAAMARLGVFRPQPLSAAPARVCGLSLLHVGGVFVLYIGLQATALLSLQIWNGTAGTLPFHEKETRKMFLLIAAQCLAVVTMLALAASLTPRGENGIGLRWRLLPRGVLWGILAALLVAVHVFTANWATALVMEWIGKTPATHEILKLLQANPPISLKILLVIGAAIAAPVTEELFFRGLLQTALIQPGLIPAFSRGGNLTTPPTAARRWLAIVLASIVFTAIHITPEFFPTLFVLSLGLGYVYERTGNLWAPITLHAMFNGVSLINTFYRTPP
jgi:membrane protease YdiL (CAAX protease family)